MSVISLREPGTARPLVARVAEEVRALKGRHDVSQEQLAGVLEISQSQVSKRLRGAVSFTLAEVQVLADYFGVAPEELLGGPTPRRPDGGSHSPGTQEQLPRLDSNQKPAGRNALRSLEAA